MDYQPMSKAPRNEVIWLLVDDVEVPASYCDCKWIRDDQALDDVPDCWMIEPCDPWNDDIELHVPTGWREMSDHEKLVEVID